MEDIETVLFEVEEACDECEFKQASALRHSCLCFTPRAGAMLSPLYCIPNTRSAPVQDNVA